MTDMSSDLATWLGAQLDEYERVARSAQVERVGSEVAQLWETQDWVELDSDVLRHVNMHSPWRRTSRWRRSGGSCTNTASGSTPATRTTP